MSDSPNALRRLARKYKVKPRFGTFVGRLRSIPSGKLKLRNRRGFIHEIPYGEPYTQLAGSFRSHREFIDDPTILTYLENTLRPGDTFVDIGASVGSVTLPGARRTGSQGRVIAIEAERTNFNQLSRNLALNDLLFVEVHHLAIADQPGEITLNVFPRSYRGRHSISWNDTEDTAAVGTEIVTCTTIDKFFQQQQIDRADILKIDIEGAEHLAWAGATQSLASGSILRIIFELTEDHDAEQDTGPLLAAGYAIHSIDEKGSLVEEHLRREELARVKWANLVAVAPGVSA